MALVQVREVVRVGLVKKVTRFLSPPNPSSPTSFLWKSDSFSMQKRTLLMSRMMDYKTSLFSTTQISTPPVGTATSAAEIHTTTFQQAEVEAETGESSSDVTSAGVSKGETDEGVLDRSYGEEQMDHHKVAESTHDLHTSTGEESESLHETGFDISKMSRPMGGE